MYKDKRYIKENKRMINLKNVSKSYNGTTKAVDNISLDIEKGEIFGFLGPNGAGKTTTIKMITGILNADEGEIKINDVDIKKEPLRAKMQFGFVPDNPDMFLRLKGIEYLNFIGDIYKVSQQKREEKIKDLSLRFNMENALNDRIQSYSHGMRQKIIIMGVLVHDPEVWILDEPMTGLDPKSSYILKEMMKEHVRSGKTVFFSTHVLEVAEKLCDRVAIISNGKVILCGKLNEIKERFKEDESLEKIFLEVTENE